MNYLPIILKIPNKEYQISINTQYFYNGTSARGEIAHHIMINEICLKTKKEHLRHNITVINHRDVEKSIGMKLTKYYTERLKWFYGENVTINNDDGKHQYDSSFSQGRKMGKTAYWKAEAEAAQKGHDFHQAFEKELHKDFYWENEIIEKLKHSNMSAKDILKKYGLNLDDIV